MPIRTNTNPRPLELTPELQDILLRNGMQAHVAASSNGFALLVQGHDSPLLNYPITEKQLKALTDWGTNTANRKAYNTFASIVAADFDMPKDFVHARNANGRVAMGLHGYRVGVGEYGRVAPYRRIPVPPHHMMGWSFWDGHRGCRRDSTCAASEDNSIIPVLLWCRIDPTGA